MPELEFQQYKLSLNAKGIIYAQSILDFNREYFTQSIGMADRAVGDFIRYTRKVLKKEKLERWARKWARTEKNKENEAN